MKKSGSRCIVLCLLMAGMLFGCMSGPSAPRDPFAGQKHPEFHTYDAPGGRKIFAAETGNPSGPLVLFIHGTPGGWHAFAGLMARPELSDKALLVSADRLGWGNSAAGGVETSLGAQAAALKAILAAHPKNLPAIVVGHSLGGPIAARLAMDAPELVGALVIVAGSDDPEQEGTTWYQFLGRLPGIHWLVPKNLAEADAEIIPLKGELEKMVPRWGELKMPVTVIQGLDDELVPAENADFAQRVITNAPLDIQRIPNQGHLIPWQRPDLMVNAVEKYIAQWKPSATPPPANNPTTPPPAP